MSNPIVDIGVACSGTQVPEWWTRYTDLIIEEVRSGNLRINSLYSISSALPDHNKNHTVSSSPWNPEEKKRYQLTDANRQEITKRFLDGPAEWLFMIDDDTIPPRGTITKLISMGKKAIGGIYFNPKSPHNPIAYIRREDGLYHAFYGYAKGTLTQVDSIGMGCTLIHRSVFEDIQKAHEVFMRPNGSLVAVRKENVIVDPYFTEESTVTRVVNNYLMMPLTKLEYESDENRPFPFFALEYGRTEDHHFWELASVIGIRPWLDTTIVCDHMKTRPFNDKDYQLNLKEIVNERKQKETESS